MRALHRLQSRNVEAYLVGGCVRDLLLGRQPKDFDIATAARPQQVKRTFPRNCRIIGRRFKLAHLHFDGNKKILEVSTFRRSPELDGEPEDLLITQDNEFGNAEEDARRRDFTVNALFFDPLRDRIIDYVGGLDDVREGLLRTIGDPIVRFREDPVRILRAAKFAGRLGLRIEETALEAMATVAPDLVRSAPPRILEEIVRLLRGGHALDSFQILRDIGALKVILPVVGQFLNDAPESERVVFWRTLESLDQAVLDGDVPSTPVLLGTLFVQPVLAAMADAKRTGTTVAEELLGPFTRELRLSRRDAGCLKRVCGVQARFTSQPKRFRVEAFLRDPYFAEALELFELRVAASGTERAALERWRALAAGREVPDVDARDEHAATDEPRDVASVDSPEAEADTGAEDDFDGAGPRKRRRRRRRRKKGGADVGSPGGEAGAEDVELEPAAEAEPRDSAAEEADADAGADDDTEDEPGDREAVGAAVGEGGGRRKRRRRRRKKSGEGREPVAAAEPAPRERRLPPADKQAPIQQAKERRRKGRETKRREPPRSRKHDGHRRLDVATIEPEPIDVSMFNVELDAKRVPTFGVLVDEKDARKKRRQPPPDDAKDTYKPPPPPGSEPPPPPPPVDDTFGDW